MKNVIFTVIAALSIASTVSAQDKGKSTKVDVGTVTVEVEYRPGINSVCTRNDKDALICTDRVNGKLVTTVVKL